MLPADMYEYLKQIAPTDTAVGAVPTITVRKYTGSFDGDHIFHGNGILHSTMGFRYNGEFVHGRIEGRGKMVWNNGITFTGEFRANAPNGRGILTWPNGDRYEGDVQHGVRHGHGTLTTARGVYVGAWVHGRREGRGRQSYGKGSHYDGDWVANQRHGRGLLVYPGGDVYDGEWVRGERVGRGAMGWRAPHHNGNDSDSDNGSDNDSDNGSDNGSGSGSGSGSGAARHFVQVYDGTWRGGVPHGVGRATYVGKPAAATDGHCLGLFLDDPDDLPIPDGPFGTDGPFGPTNSFSSARTPAAFAPPVAAVVNVYEGEWACGARDGRGAFFYADGSVYEGTWRRGAKCGRGRLTTSAGASVYISDAGSAAEEARVHDFVESCDCLPVPSLDGLLGVADGAPEEAAAALRLQLLRHNSALRGLFASCAARRSGVALAAATPPDWWRWRLPGHVALPQLMQMFADARLLSGRVALREAVQCVVATLQREIAAERSAQCRDGGAWSTRLRDLAADAARLNGALNFRQFVETLVRLAALAVAGPGAACTVAGRFAALVEGPLARVIRSPSPVAAGPIRSPTAVGPTPTAVGPTPTAVGPTPTAVGPLCPATRRAEGCGALAERIGRLRELFERLAGGHRHRKEKDQQQQQQEEEKQKEEEEEEEEEAEGEGVRRERGEGPLVQARRVVGFAHAFLQRHGVGAAHALAHVLPFDRFAASGAAPPGICPTRNALGQRIFERSCGAHGELAAVRVAGERMLTFVEFVEVIVAFAEITCGEETVAQRLDEILNEPIHTNEHVLERRVKQEQ